MFFQRPDLTSGSRPTLQQDEVLLFVQDGVGLYEGKYKIADCQNGHAYLTSHRACYVDGTDPRNHSLAVDLKDVDRHEYQAGFLRSSPKVTLHPKPPKRGIGSLRQQSPGPAAIQRLQSASLPASRTASPFRPSSIPATPTPVPTANWICPICSFHNPVPSNFDPATASESFPLPPCLTCGIKPPFSLVLKAVIAASTNRPAASVNPKTPPTAPAEPSVIDKVLDKQNSGVKCPLCTFINHPSLKSCEICGASLSTLNTLQPTVNGNAYDRTSSPGPEIATLQAGDVGDLQAIKFSFRTGGDKTFYDRLKNAMIQRKWIVTNAPPVPRPLDNLRVGEDYSSDGGSPERSPRIKAGVGIAGLEQRGMQSRKKNETVIETAFEDLEALMASAKEIVALAEKFAVDSQQAGNSDATPTDPILSESAAALGMFTTRNTAGDSSNSLFISELARTLAEYVTNEHRGLLRKQGGIMSLVDVWADYNKARNGIELISPSDFHKATEMWQVLGLPVRLRQFRSGLLVIQRYDWNDEKTISQLKLWLESLRQSPPPVDMSWDCSSFGVGVTAQDAAQRFGWSLGVASEELEMAEERGVLCREEGIQGLKFWINYLDRE